jgi:MoaA/NifB/PqqE/SkfB family radical SAM enzyme
MDKPHLSYLQIEPTTHCNFTCGFCAGRHMHQQHMQPDTFEQVISSVEGLEYVSIQGEGEPLLNPRFFDMVQEVKRLHPGVHVSFISNGSLFSTGNIDKILSLGIYRIMVSIESADEATFREIRGGKLSKVLSGIRALLEERKKRGMSKPLVGFAATVLRRTLHEYKNIIALYNELGLDGGITCQYLQNMEAYTQFYSDDMKAEILLDEDIRRLEETAGSDPEALKLITRELEEPNFYSSLLLSPSEGCPWLSNGLYVHMNGQASGCCFMKDVARDGFGPLTPTTADVVFQKRQQLQEQLLDGEIPRGCKDCSIALAIQQRIRLKNYHT